LELCQRLHWGSSKRSPNLLAGFKGVLLLRQGSGRKGKTKGKEGIKGKEKEKGGRNKEGER